MNIHIDFHAFAHDYVAANPISNLYFLLDQGGLPGLHRQLSKTGTEWISLLDGTNESNATEVAPILLLACRCGKTQLPWGLLEWINENGTYTSSVILLSTPLELHVLKRRLVKRLDVTLTDEMSAMLRFFDPRVFEGLMNVLRHEQIIAFLNPAQRWWYVDRAGAIQCVDSPTFDDKEVDDQIVLDERQEASLIERCEADQVLASLREYAPNLIEREILSRQYDFVAKNIEKAKTVGLRAIADLILYNVVVLTMGPAFIEGPIWSSLMHATSLSPADFSALVLCLNVDDAIEES